jgi:ABC-2 type transport system permease protein
VFEFSNEWRNYLVPMLFKQQKFTKQSYSQLPIFNYMNRVQNNTWLDMLVLVIVSAIIFFMFVNKSLKNRSAQNYI